MSPEMKVRMRAREVSANIDELFQRADQEDSVIVTRQGGDRLIVVSIARFEALVEQLKQAATEVIPKPDPHDRGGEDQSRLQQAVAAIEKLGPHDRGGSASSSLASDIKPGMHDRGG
ncbi:MAG TPA: hypothetical protein VJG32_05870 [Anaerolineae bacterium]|nr:hypothetical protein [Anaerolineae bacterium]